MLIERDIFNLTDAAIQTPYREQNPRYRTAMTNTTNKPFWQALIIWGTKLKIDECFAAVFVSRDSQTPGTCSLHSFAQTLQLIEMLIEKDIFNPTDIAIQTPYREQNARYRTAMANTAKTPF